MNMKKLVSMVIALVMMLTIVSATPAHALQRDDVTVIINGRTLTFDVPPVIVNGRTMVPIRFIGEELGARFDWDGVAQTVYAQMGDTEIVLPIGSTSPTVNGEVVTIDQPAFIGSGRTLVPLRFISEAFGINVEWDNATRTVLIGSQTQGQQPVPPQPPNLPAADAIQATITMEDGGVIVLELYPGVAPQSVQNFVYLARQGFYDGLKFHRIIKGFVIQGGCPQGSGMGGPGYSIFGEFEDNGFINDLKHTRGVVSMARGGHDFNSAGSQFFIMHADSLSLDGSYAAFGRVISGMDVVDRLADTPVYDNNGSVAPGDMPVIASITIDSDIQLPEPDKLTR